MLAILGVPLVGYPTSLEWTCGAIERFRRWLARNGGHALAIGAVVICLALIVRGALQYGG